MTNQIPKWVMERYSVLWKKYHNEEITYEQIDDTLKIDDKNTIGVFLNELRKAGWIEVTLSKEDLRKRIYVLREPQEVLQEIMIDANKNYKSRSSG